MAGKSTRSAELTRKKILETARGLFAKNGYHGTSTAEIVLKANCNKRMLYHYFGDKEGLYREVHESGWREFRDYMLAEISSYDPEAPIQERLLAAMGSYFDYYKVRLDSVRLSMWESLEGGKILNDLWDDYRGPLTQEFGALVNEAQEKGILAPGLDPAHLLLSILGANNYYIAFHSTLEDILGAPAMSEAVLEIRKEQFLLLMKNLFVNK